MRKAFPRAFSRAFRPAFGAASGGQTDPILALFANCQAGISVEDFSDPSRMFQDEAATIPAGADDPVGAILDSSRNETLCTQSGDARPILRTDGDVWWLEYTGDQWLKINVSADLQNTTLIAAVELHDSTSDTRSWISGTREVHRFYSSAAQGARKGNSGFAGVVRTNSRQVITAQFTPDGLVSRQNAFEGEFLEFDQPGPAPLFFIGAARTSTGSPVDVPSQFFRGKFFGFVAVIDLPPLQSLVRAEKALIDSAKVPRYLQQRTIDNDFTEQTDGLDVGRVFGSRNDIAITQDDGVTYLYENKGRGEYIRHTINSDAVAGAEVEGLCLFQINGSWGVAVCDQSNGEIRIYTPDSPGAYDGGWSGAVLQSDRFRAQDIRWWDVDGTGAPQLVYTWEGANENEGGVHTLRYNGSGDPLEASNWSDHVLCQIWGAWGLPEKPVNMLGNGRDDIVFSARKRNITERPAGIYILEQPVDKSLNSPWQKHTITDHGIDWIRFDIGNYFGTSDLDIVATNRAQRVWAFDKDNDWNRVEILSDISAGSIIWNVRSLWYKEGGRSGLLVLGSDEASVYEYESGWTLKASVPFSKADDFISLKDLDGNGQPDIITAREAGELLNLRWRSP